MVKIIFTGPCGVPRELCGTVLAGRADFHRPVVLAEMNTSHARPATKIPCVCGSQAFVLAVLHAGEIRILPIRVFRMGAVGVAVMQAATLDHPSLIANGNLKAKLEEYGADSALAPFIEHALGK